MPGKDGTGPSGQGMRRGSGKSRAGKGVRAGAGPGGNCLCPGCGRTMAHQAGVPCSSMMCPWCGSSMIRIKQI